MIELHEVIFRYPHSSFKLRIDALQIAASERVAFVGPSGSGKTTLLNLLSGIDIPQHGTISVAGQNLNSMSDARRRDFRITRIGMVFQQFELIPYLNVTNNVLLPYRINSRLRLDGGVRERCRELLRLVGLEDKEHRFPHQLSQGEQQRTALCRALIHEPGLILADEPTGNLDPENKHKVIDILFQQTESVDRGLIVVTHDESILNGFDRIVDFREFLQTAEVNK
ncbi:MAG: ABC transporter ATP-binding protein [Pirellulaceae bacterium]